MPRRSARGLTAVLSHVDEHRFNTNTVSRKKAYETGGARCKLEDVTMSRLRGKPSRIQFAGDHQSNQSRG
jgi:hypothetical protein